MSVTVSVSGGGGGAVGSNGGRSGGANEEEGCCGSNEFVVVTNIPPWFQAADLRMFFSHFFVESGGFACFHYRHRPQGPVQEERSLGNKQPFGFLEKSCKWHHGKLLDRGIKHGAVPRCCVVRLGQGGSTLLSQRYNGNFWFDRTGQEIGQQCNIYPVTITRDDPQPPHSRRELSGWRPGLKPLIACQDLPQMPELLPPDMLCHGNVGTPLHVFQELIRSCRLPPSLITRLDLAAQLSGPHRKYSNVPWMYTQTTGQEALMAFGSEGRDQYLVPSTVKLKWKRDQRRGRHKIKARKHSEPNSELASFNPEDESHSDNDSCEEWERHEALHEDVTRQERTEERLYEEEVELPWEKGGSGLVYYTDAQYWAQEQGDFDEQTADDLDVDMSIYYEEGGGDYDARDYLALRRERRCRAGKSDSVQNTQRGEFERHTKGFGRRIMEQQGWRDGFGLGSAQHGCIDALDNDGQSPSCRHGFGYHGEKLPRFFLPRRTRRDPPGGIVLTTVYDNPLDIDSGDSLLRRQPLHALKLYGHSNKAKTKSFDPQP
uniref:G patch domain-containing protein 3 n=1 Tax=Myxine glutinosa TaxID=7769 RepID=UPI00358F4D48